LPPPAPQADASTNSATWAAKKEDKYSKVSLRIFENDTYLPWWSPLQSQYDYYDKNHENTVLEYIILMFW